MTNSQNSASTDFSAIVLHPNTEQAIIEQRKKFLAKNVITSIDVITSNNDINSTVRTSDWFETFPLYGIFENDFSILKSSDNSKQEITSKSAGSLKACAFTSYFIFEDFLFFKATLTFENGTQHFYIPFAVNKNAKDKTIIAAFTTAQKINCTQIKKEIPLENEISFKSFQTAVLELTSNQFKTYDNKWIKTNPDEIL